MADDDGGGKETWTQTLRTKVGGVPIAVPIGVGVLALAWYLRRRAQSQTAAQDQPVVQQVANPGLSTDSNTLPYMGGPVFLTVNPPAAPSSAGTPTTPPAAGTPNPPPAPSPAPTPTPVSAGPTSPPPPQKVTQTYAVHSGDTLSAIARRYGLTSAQLYAANRSTIENTAHAHGFRSSDQGHTGQFGWWIFPNEKLLIPR